MGDWKQKADDRIERHRKGDFVVRIGAEPAGTAVSARLVRHHFRFGMCIGGDPASAGPDQQRYFRFIAENFNTLVCENDMKWYATERQRGQVNYDRADALMAFAEKHEMAMRGHCLFWSKPKFVQPWVQELDDAALRVHVESRLESVVKRYKGRLIAWDVNNEMLDGSFFKDRLGDDIRAWMFRRARELDPHVPLHVNEYGILGSDEKTGQYIDLIRSLQDRGAVGGIGVQEHAAERFVPVRGPATAEAFDERKGGDVLVPDEVWGRLDRLAELRLPIHLTEISSKTPDPLRRADTLEMLFRVGFAHPSVEAILLWGFWEKRHWLGPEAALVDAQWNLLPAGQRVLDLMHREWTTHAQARTDARGTIRFRGFFGRYELELTRPDGTKRRAVVELRPGALEADAVLNP